jgi:uncharacterized membrane protein
VLLSDRHSPAGNWLYPLISGLALFILAAAAVYVLTSLWRERTADIGVAETTTAPAPASTPASPSSLSAVEILDRRLASGEITIEEYEKLDALLARRHTAADATATVAASNGAATAAV